MPRWMQTSSLPSHFWEDPWDTDWNPSLQTQVPFLRQLAFSGHRGQETARNIESIHSFVVHFIQEILIEHLWCTRCCSRKNLLLGIAYWHPFGIHPTVEYRFSPCPTHSPPLPPIPLLLVSRASRFQHLCFLTEGFLWPLTSFLSTTYWFSRSSSPRSSFLKQWWTDWVSDLKINQLHILDMNQLTRIINNKNCNN